ncbi:DUF2339 domain-containing protein [Bacillus carboniphilus]|uniref:DUF2339 domain-containing protein n=1 Tax=Bacillus carboniphilus TaxID=86663 RepID=A0ABY9JVW7_9BACI|nr:DUF2339 domain-containing protein [Bacillus carboniphilus]WLR42893.1 DUF2339 domain-containing protein [Bacillus carboniphilus]
MKQNSIEHVFPYPISLLILVFFTKISQLTTGTFDPMFSSTGVSIAWMIFVLVIYGAYSYFKDKHWNYIGLSFLIITLSKITLFDLYMVDIVWRAILFIALGVIGLLISRIFYKNTSG